MSRKKQTSNINPTMSLVSITWEWVWMIMWPLSSREGPGRTPGPSQVNR